MNKGGYFDEAYKDIEYTDDYRDEFYNLVRMMEKRS